MSALHGQTALPNRGIYAYWLVVRNTGNCVLYFLRSAPYFILEVDVRGCNQITGFIHTSDQRRG